MPENQTENQRLFIAIFPPTSLSRALHKFARQQHAMLGGRCMPAVNLHLTLAFLGDTPVSQIPLILEVLQRQPALDCTLGIDTLGAFRNGGIVWAGCSAVPETLINWVGRLRDDLAENQIAFDPKPFRAHITLLRKAAPAASAIEPALSWQLGNARLYASVSAEGRPVYQPIDAASNPAS